MSYTPPAIPKFFKISYHSASVVGATEKAPEISVEEVEEYVVAGRVYPQEFFAVVVNGSLIVTYPAGEVVMPVKYEEPTYRFGRKMLIKVTEKMLEEAFEHENFEPRNDREAWVRTRNQMIILELVGLLPS